MCAQRGFSFIEVLGAVVILALGLLAQAAGALSERRLAMEQEARSQAHQAVRQFMERMRSDEAWPTLYGRLRSFQLLASLPGAPGMKLDDGRSAFPPNAYYADFTTPPSLGTAGVLVDVPFDATASGPLAAMALREDVVDQAYGLPGDLNGDGMIDGDSRNADYAAIPVIVTFRWVPPGEGGREIKVGTWLRGER
ncbi:MAG: prepilin-type N-terminal cleavage/methylation domain-containing protein [Planctomycetota bacterium]|jgi:prepilin-type N-terminal cleavage/methylation domain-containing protein